MANTSKRKVFVAMIAVGGQYWDISKTTTNSEKTFLRTGHKRNLEKIDESRDVAVDWGKIFSFLKIFVRLQIFDEKKEKI